MTRCRVGEKADKLANIVASYMPQLANETRAYMIRFPHEVKKLLKKARQIRKKIKARKKRRDAPAASQATPARRAQQQAAAAKPEQEGMTNDKCEEPRSPAATGEEKATVPAETEGNEFDDVDWGSPDSEIWSPEGKNQPEVRAPTWERKGQQTPNRSPRRDGKSLGAQRPRTPSRSPRRDGASLGAQRPRTPSRSPRRNPVHLRPSHKWEEVQRVQEHMRASNSEDLHIAALL